MLTFHVLALHQSENKGLTLKTSVFKSLYGGQVTFSYQLCFYSPPMQHHSSLETNPLIHLFITIVLFQQFGNKQATCFIKMHSRVKYWKCIHLCRRLLDAIDAILVVIILRLRATSSSVEILSSVTLVNPLTPWPAKTSRAVRMLCMWNLIPSPSPPGFFSSWKGHNS